MVRWLQNEMDRFWGWRMLWNWTRGCLLIDWNEGENRFVPSRYRTRAEIIWWWCFNEIFVLAFKDRWAWWAWTSRQNSTSCNAATDSWRPRSRSARSERSFKNSQKASSHARAKSQRLALRFLICRMSMVGIIIVIFFLILLMMCAA